jgi:reactive intermediate/imine deaminase
MAKYIINTEHAPKALGAYSQGIKHGDLLITSGQIGIDPTTMKLVEGVENQIRQTFANLKAICEAGGGSLGDILKLTVFLIDRDAWPLVNKVMAELFSGQFPARTALGVAWLPLDAKVEVEAIVRLQPV